MSDLSTLPPRDALRLSNTLRAQRAYRTGQWESGAGPLVAYIEVAARCNLRCPMCPITVDPRHAPGSGLPALLSAALFDRLSGVFPTLQRAHLFGLGEPFLNPHLVHYVERLAAAGVETWTTTNATLVTEERADAIARAGLARVNVSIDGATPETYARIRRGGRLEEAVRGIRALSAARRRHGRPQLVLSMVTMASNLRELPDLVDLCAACGGDGVFAEELYSYSHPSIEEVYAREHLGNLPREERREIFEEARQRARRHGLEFASRVAESPSAARARSLPSLPAAGSPGSGAAAPALPFPCSEPWATINVNAAGEVRTCCFNDTSFGRLDEEPAEAIWKGEAYARLRRDHAEGRTPEREKFAACLPIPFVTAGQHQFRVRWRRKGDRVPLAPEFSVPVTVFDGDGDSMAAVGRAAVPVPLPRRETRPRWSLDGRSSIPAEWLCVRRAADFLGVLVVDTAALCPGPHELELTLSKETLRRPLQRLEAPG